VKLVPRGDEVAEIVAIMERDYPTGEAMAKDIIKQVADFLWFRTWYVLVIRKRNAAFGPFASEAEAHEFGRKFQGIIVPSDPEDWGVAPVIGLGGTVEERQGGGFGYCCTEACGHPAWAHSMVGPSRGSCVLSSCNCGRYEQAKAKPKPRASRAKKVTS
jgi:hypothetical protein